MFNGLKLKYDDNYNNMSSSELRKIIVKLENDISELKIDQSNKAATIQDLNISIDKLKNDKYGEHMLVDEIKMKEELIRTLNQDIARNNGLIQNLREAYAEYALNGTYYKALTETIIENPSLQEKWTEFTTLFQIIRPDFDEYVKTFIEDAQKKQI